MLYFHQIEKKVPPMSPIITSILYIRIIENYWEELEYNLRPGDFRLKLSHFQPFFGGHSVLKLDWDVRPLINVPRAILVHSFAVCF